MRRPLVLLLSLQLFLILLVSQTTSFFEKPAHPFLIETTGPKICEGHVVSSSVPKEKGSEFIVDLARCEGRTLQGRVKINVFGEAEELILGDWVRFRGAFRRPKDFQNPGSFKMSRYYHSQGISLSGSVSDPAWIVRLPAEPLDGWRAWIEKIRKNIQSSVLKANPDRAGGFLLALLIGESHFFPKEAAEAFRQTGVAHIIAISGLHITLVTVLFLGFFRFFSALPLFSRRVFISKFYPLAAIPLVWLYLAVAYYPVSGVRAGVMATLFLIGLTVWRKLDWLSALYLAAFLILSLKPLALFQASFQLSFMAVLFLILFYPRWLALQRGWFLNLSAVSVIALLGVGPLLLFHFHQFSFIGLIANLVCVPWSSFLLMPPALLGWFLSGLFGLELFSFWKIVGWQTELFIRFVEWLGGNSQWGIFYGSISVWQIVFYYGACFVFLAPREWPAKKWRLATAGGLMAVVLWGGQMPADGKLKVTFVDVGQGDSVVVQLPNGKVWVVDGGGIRGNDWDIGRFIIAPFLWEEGIHKIETLFLSHPHHDHYKGLGFLAEHFSPKILFTNGDAAPEGEAEEWQEFLAKIEKGNIAVQKVTRNTRAIEEAGVRLEFLAPGSQGTIPHFDVNDNSIVLRLSYKQVSFLLPGDLMEAGELLLLESKLNVKADVLKTGHHGSATSTKEVFLNAVQPKYAVMSVGAYNPYGMPSQELVNRLKQKGISLFRTDLHGAVTFTTDGTDIDVKTFVP